MIILLDRAQVGLWAGAAAAVIGAIFLALSENNHRVEMRESVDIVADNASNMATTDASKLAALVELIRALAHPFHTVFRTSRTAVAVGAAGVLVIAAALIPVLATALLANHCKPHFAPQPAPAATVSSTASPGADETVGGRTPPVVFTVAEDDETPAPQPSPVFAPSCEED